MKSDAARSMEWKRRPWAVRPLGIGTAVTTLTALGAAIVLHDARAEGAPAVEPLVYSGMLEDDNGPIDGMRRIDVKLWDAETTGAMLCQTVPSNNTQVTRGRFQVLLDPACVAAVRA